MLNSTLFNKNWSSAYYGLKTMLIPSSNMGSKGDLVPISQSFQSDRGGEKTVPNTNLKDSKCYDESREDYGGVTGNNWGEPFYDQLSLTCALKNNVHGIIHNKHFTNDSDSQVHIKNHVHRFLKIPRSPKLFHKTLTLLVWLSLILKVTDTFIMHTSFAAPLS